MSTTKIKPAKRPTWQQKVRGTLERAKPLYAILGGIGLLLGILTAALALLPRITVTPSDPVDPTNTLSSSFTIQNNNFVPLHHVTAMLAVGEIEKVGVPLQHPGTKWSYESRLSNPDWLDHDLGMDERFTITPDQILHATYVGAGEVDIAIVVVFEPWFIPLRRETVYRFHAYKQTNGNYTWLSLPLK